MCVCVCVYVYVYTIFTCALEAADSASPRIPASRAMTRSASWSASSEASALSPA